MKSQRFNKGYPVDPLFTTRVSPIESSIRPTPEPDVANPGEIFSKQPTLEIGLYSFTLRPQIAPDLVLRFASVRRYNCIEIGIGCKATPRGWAVPSYAAIMLDKNSMSGYGTTAPTPSTPPTVRLEAPSLVSGGDTSEFQNFRQDFTFQPSQTFVTAVANDGTTSSSLFGSSLFRIFHPVSFRFATLFLWGKYQENHQPFSFSNTPTLSVRAWYDPSVRTLQNLVP